MSVLDEPKIDCHCHILDPAGFPYRADTAYRPAGQEVATAAQFRNVLDFYGVRHALLVGPNSGYGIDNRCLLDAIDGGEGRFKGIAVVPLDVGTAELARLKARGIVGVAYNSTLQGVGYYLGSGDLLARLADLGMFLQIQLEKDQLLGFMPLIERSAVRLLIDHCGRPPAEAGLGQPGFKALLALGRSGRAAVKLSGYQKFAREHHPYRDAWPFVQALADAFTLDRCLWGSDWPFLKATERIDYGPLLALATMLFPNAAERRKVFWDTPRRMFGFGA